MAEYSRKAIEVRPLPRGAVAARASSRSTGTAPDPAATIETGDIWRILRARRGSLLAVTILVSVAGIGFSLIVRPNYAATAQILIDPRDRPVFDRSLLSDAPPPDSGITQVESQARLIESDAVLLRAIRDLDLTKDPEFGPPPPSRGLLARLLPSATRPVDGPDATTLTMRNLRQHLSVRRSDKALVIDIVVSAHDPDDAARVASGIADAYISDAASARTRFADAAAAALAARLAPLKQRAEDAASELETYRASAGFVGSFGQPVIDAQLAAANAEFSNAQIRADAARARQAQVQQMMREGVLATSASDATSPVLSQLRTSLATQADALARLKLIYAPKHPTVMAAQAAFDRAQAEMRAEVGRVARIAEVDVGRAESDAASAQARLEAAKQEAVSLNTRLVQLRELQGAADAARAVYQSFLTRSGELTAQAGIESTNSRVISRSLPPLQTSGPHRSLIVAASVLAGLALGAFTALLCEYLRPTVLSRADLRRQSGAGLVGIVSASALKSVTPTSTDVVDLRDAATNATVLRLLKSHTRGPGKGRARFIGLISLPGQGAERSRLATLMAGMAVRQGLSVLVIGPDSHQRLPGSRLPPSVAGKEEERHRLPRRPGRITRVPPEMHRSLTQVSQVEDMLGAIAGQFDLVVVDIDDLVGSPQAVAMTNACDETVIVAREGRTGQAALRDLADLADACGRGTTAGVLVSGAGRL